MRKSARRAGATLAGLACGLAAATVGVGADQESSPAMEIGVQDDAVLLERRNYSEARAFRQVTRLGATRIRVGMTWEQAVLRRRGDRVLYDFRPYDRLVTKARQRGIKVQIALLGTPKFDRGGDRWLSYRSPRPERMARFAGDVARHFRGRVDRYSIWNEPNSETFLAPQRACSGDSCELVGARLYRALVDAAHPAIKAADPSAQVLVGETAPNASVGKVVAPLAFLREAACADADYGSARPCPGLVADGYAHHPYQFLTPPDRPVAEPPDEVGLSGLPRLNDALVRLAASGAVRTPAGDPLPVYLTEFGYFKQGSRKRTLTEVRRADYTVRAFKQAASYPWVRQMVYYHFVETPPGARWNSGLIDLDGGELKPYRALRNWSMRRPRG